MSDIQKFTVYPSIISPFGFEMKPQDDGEWVRYEDINKIKADAVREAAEAVMSFDWHYSYACITDFEELLIEYADKLERGE